MDRLPVGWTLHTRDPEGDGAGLLGAPEPDPDGAARVCDLFHEDAQVG